MKIAYSKNFIKKSKKLNPVLRKKIVERVAKFSYNPVDPQLHDHQLKGKFKHYRSINITGDYRALYSLNDDEAIFDIIGTHSQIY